MQDGRAPGRTASHRGLLLACLTSLLTGLLLGLAAPASAVEAPVFTSTPDSLLTGASATWTWTADGAATHECWLLTDGTPRSGPQTWFDCASGSPVLLAAGDGDDALVVRATAKVDGVHAGLVLVQNRIDHRDPTLAGAIVDQDEELEFRPWRTSASAAFPRVPRPGGAPA